MDTMLGTGAQTLALLGLGSGSGLSSRGGLARGDLEGLEVRA